jgi:hypothetical protein
LFGYIRVTRQSFRSGGIGLLEVLGVAEEIGEGLRCFLCDSVWGFFEFVGDFEDAWCVGGKSCDVSSGVGPVDT